MSTAVHHSPNGVNGVESPTNAVPGPSKATFIHSPSLSQSDLAPDAQNGHEALENDNS
jgi:hypothetical protein